MIILSRKYRTQKSPKELQSIVKSFAYHFPCAHFSENTFSLYHLKRYNAGMLALIKLKGTIMFVDGNTELFVSVCAGVDFFIGGAISLLGILGALFYLVGIASHWLAFVGMLVLGLLMLCQSLWQGASILDAIQSKLSNP